MWGCWALCSNLQKIRGEHGTTTAILTITLTTTTTTATTIIIIIIIIIMTTTTTPMPQTLIKEGIYRILSDKFMFNELLVKHPPLLATI